MSSYILAMVDVTNWEQYKKYTLLTPAIIEQYGGRFLTRGGRMEVLEGSMDDRRMVLLEFPTYEDAQAFYNSPEYQAAMKLRKGAANGTFIALEGL